MRDQAKSSKLMRVILRILLAAAIPATSSAARVGYVADANGSTKLGVLRIQATDTTVGGLVLVANAVADPNATMPPASGPIYFSDSGMLYSEWDLAGALIPTLSLQRVWGFLGPLSFQGVFYGTSLSYRLDIDRLEVEYTPDAVPYLAQATSIAPTGNVRKDAMITRMSAAGELTVGNGHVVPVNFEYSTPDNFTTPALTMQWLSPFDSTAGFVMTGFHNSPSDWHQIGSIGGVNYDISFNVNLDDDSFLSVPEPSGEMPLGSGLAALVALSISRRGAICVCRR